VSFANTCHFVACIFILLTVSFFIVQKNLI
jgi:hypothetical protein